MVGKNSDPVMNQKMNELPDRSELAASANDHLSLARSIWRRDGLLIVDGAGKKVAAMQGVPAEYEWYQRRIVAAVNAMQDTPIQFIEEFVDNIQDNIILKLITQHR
jgi:hypothetical protein